MDMNRIRARYPARAGWLVLLLMVLASAPGVVCGQRTCCEGDMWLKWTDERRESYVWGYMIGYSQGYWEGCRQAMKSLPTGTNPQSIENGCRKRQPDFSNGTTYWAKQVTEFYKTYANDRDIDVDEILQQLRNGLTLEQIHKYPFMRRRSEGNSKESKP